jgi:hypothetical protein
MTQIARGLALAALTLAGQVAFAQTMYRVVEITGGDPLAITSNGKILVNGSNSTYYVCDETHCRSLPLVREDPLTHWNSLNDQGMLTGDAKKPNSGQQCAKEPPARRWEPVSYAGCRKGDRAGWCRGWHDQQLPRVSLHGPLNRVDRASCVPRPEGNQ